jgi:hypothetical protein
MRFTVSIIWASSSAHGADVGGGAGVDGAGVGRGTEEVLLAVVLVELELVVSVLVAVSVVVKVVVVVTVVLLAVRVDMVVPVIVAVDMVVLLVFWYT